MIRYEMTKGQRVKKQKFFGVTTFDDFWWSNEYQRWVPVAGDHGKYGGSSHFNGCRSVRAFRRRLREWSHYLPKGVKFYLVSCYRGYNVTGTTTG
jgi:hypothetical protein